MTKRKLSKEEKNFSQKNLTILKEEAEYLELVDLPKVRHTLSTVELVVKKQVKQTQKEENQLIAKLNELVTTIKILEDQIKNGVEKKKTKKEDK